MPNYQCKNCAQDDQVGYSFCRSCGNHLQAPSIKTPNVQAPNVQAPNVQAPNVKRNIQANQATPIQPVQISQLPSLHQPDPFQQTAPLHQSAQLSQPVRMSTGLRKWDSVTLDDKKTTIGFNGEFIFLKPNSFKPKTTAKFRATQLLEMEIPSHGEHITFSFRNQKGKTELAGIDIGKERHWHQVATDISMSLGMNVTQQIKVRSVLRTTIYYLIAGLIVALLLGALFWMAASIDPNQQGGPRIGRAAGLKKLLQLIGPGGVLILSFFTLLGLFGRWIYRLFKPAYVFLYDFRRQPREQASLVELLD